ncbi:3-isopropylmalate dehydrogenase [Alicyclobacillus acidoterrestris]|uniref:3-isopropylmalate dehydrogenase n=1 Tax=Alicyclobacillus acidoterrestris (strain ATCC 49025 / DSM 3922 / CIP 106132 / NCIMB 13137 / GD3B) TaxID=1356854 RepID=T0D0N6_ALIAG|nr:3-isopropylmalate dehydrogenase [Alicyclobacillus acidoterrestris]EPZ45067.1 3-isopropylmalate dehydrogenase [Alicyclobacillus acidoterrestris ATCC 49025]UNO48356.1 3-isopropylmalate dehydrogenase [Alicyclobacillus acidoterrestris]
MTRHITILPGDGIGPEVTKEARRLLEEVAQTLGETWTLEEALIGGAAYDQTGHPLPPETIAKCKASDAVLLGAVGGPKWDHLPGDVRPEAGLLGIRKQLGVFANLRPIRTWPGLLLASPLKPELLDGVDMVIVRELTGGLYFGEPKQRLDGGNAVVDTLHYTRHEIERVVRQAFEIAQNRRKKVTSVDKANVLESSRMWREIVQETAAAFPDVTVEPILVDSAAMQLIQRPNQFDVVVTENMFGDILSDEAAVLTGSIGMLPSASLGSGGPGLYEPVHGSAPDIAGQGIANPLAGFLSVAMLLRHSLGLEAAATAIEDAVLATIEAGHRTRDLAGHDSEPVGTEEMSALVRHEVQRRLNG